MTLSKSFTSREKILLAVLGILIVAAAYLLLVHQPVTKSLDEINLQQIAAEDEIVVLQAKVARLAQMKNELKQIMSQPGGTATTPTYDNLQQVMILLNSILSPTMEYNLSFQTVQWSADESIARRVINMTFTCATYRQTKAIVEQLHNGPYRCQVGALTVTSNAGMGQTRPDINVGVVEASLSITFYETQPEGPPVVHQG